MATFSIEVSVLTPDKLKLIKFKLVKEVIEAPDVEDVDKDKDTKELIPVNHWTLTFSFAEKKKEADAFPTQPTVSLTADISKALEAKSQETLEKGFDNQQRAALQAAFEKLKLFNDNRITKKVLDSAMNNVIARRGA